jgi:nucleotide-binding universal stress UspA family protein
VKHIVVGISDAETSKIAGRQAFEIAGRFGATVHVVTAVEAPETVSIDVGSERYVFDDIDAASSSIQRFVESLAPTVEWRVVASDAKPAKALLDVASEVGADLIVVGNVGMQGFGRVLGSVGNDVVHHAPCSVLIVKTV